MTGLLALLDDVAAIAKLTATQLDDISALAAKAGAKSAGVVIDDAAVTPKYVAGLPAARELPIVLKIARGSLFNKLVILGPAALALNAIAPFLLSPLLMIGGLYLCFEGAEKIIHALAPHHADDAHASTAPAAPIDAAHLEHERVAGAIKTDFVLSAEIIAISLSAIETDSLWKEAAVLGGVSVFITALVYGGVAMLVKADDVGLRLAQAGRLKATRAFGRGLVSAMPAVVAAVGVIGTAAMLWVGGSILLHGLKDLGLSAPYDGVHHAAEAVAHGVPAAAGFVGWLTTAALDGAAGLVAGIATVVVVAGVVSPALRAIKRRRKPEEGGDVAPGVDEKAGTAGSGAELGPEPTPTNDSEADTPLVPQAGPSA